MESLKRLRDFVVAMTRLVERNGADEAVMLKQGGTFIADLIAHDDWLPQEFASADGRSFSECLLHCDPLERFSVVSCVCAAGYTTPIHDHTVWGLVGLLRGAERCMKYARPSGRQPMAMSAEHIVKAGAVDAISPTVVDIHAVSNTRTDGASISIHVYGANIGAVKRHVYDPSTGDARPFVSGYSNTGTPNFWGHRADNA